MRRKALLVLLVIVCIWSTATYAERHAFLRRQVSDDNADLGEYLRNRFFLGETNYLSQIEWPKKRDKVACFRKLDGIDFLLRLGVLTITYQTSQFQTLMQKTFRNEMLQTLTWSEEKLVVDEYTFPVFQSGELEVIINNLDSPETEEGVIEVSLVDPQEAPELPFVILRSKSVPEWEEYALDFLSHASDEELETTKKTKTKMRDFVFNAPSNLPSVITLVLESTSRPMVKHYTPNLESYFRSMRDGGDRRNGSHRAFVMEGYHSASVGNTEPNLTPMFSGIPAGNKLKDALEEQFYHHDCNDRILSATREKFYWSRYAELGYFTVNGMTGDFYFGCWKGMEQQYACRDWSKTEHSFVEALMQGMNMTSAEHREVVERELCKFTGDVWQGSDRRLRGCGGCHCCRHRGMDGRKPKLWRCAEHELQLVDKEQFAEKCTSIGGTVKNANALGDFHGCDCSCCRKTPEYFGNSVVFSFGQPAPRLGGTLAVARRWTKEAQCVGSRYIHEAHMDELIRTLERKVAPVFAYLHLYEAHDERQFGTLLEDSLAKKIDELMEKAPNSIIIAVGDHGPVNMFDQSMPYLSILMPKSLLKTENAKKYIIAEHLQANEKRLLTPFDIHLTFGHILSLFGNGSKVNACYGKHQASYPECMLRVKDGVGPFRRYTPATNNHRARSLFERIPANRSCAEAGLTDFNCGDGAWKSILNDKSTKAEFFGIPNQVLGKINNYLRSKGRGDKDYPCKILKFHQILSLELQGTFPLSEPSRRHLRYVRLLFSTVDEGLGAAIFHAVFSYSKLDSQKVFKAVYMSQQARFNRWRQCKPPGTHRYLCVCNASSTGRN
jgi:hypothetical protein